MGALRAEPTALLFPREIAAVSIMMRSLPLWTALDWRRWVDPANIEEMRELGLKRALGYNAENSIALLRRGSGEIELNDEEQGQLSAIIRRLTAVWAGMTPSELRSLKKYLDSDKQPQIAPYPIISVPPFSLPQGMEKAWERGIELHAYQNRAVMYAERPRSVLALEMGLGKTLIALVSAHRAIERGEIDRVVIVAPRSAHGSWSEHLSQYTSTVHAIASGWTPAQRESAYRAVYYGALPVIVITPQTLSIDKPYFKRILDHHGRSTMLIVDEAHRAKSEDSQIGQTIEELSPLAKRVLGLTGTPQPNTIADLYHLINRVSIGALGNLSDFATRYTYREVDQWDSIRGQSYRAGPLRADRIEELHGRIREIMLVISAGDEDVNLALPERIDLAPYIPMDDLQREILRALNTATAAREINSFIYGEALAGTRGEIELIAAEGATANTQSLGVRFEQLSISPALFSPTFDSIYPDYESPKIKWIAEETVKYLSTEEAVVIFCEHLGGLDIMKRALVKRGVPADEILKYTGSTAERERITAAQMLNYGGCRVLLGQTKALETGANLQHRAGLVAHLSTPWSPDTLAQSTARVYRQGQKRRVFVLRPSGSRIEEAKNAALSRKLIQSSAATGLHSEADLAIIHTASDPRIRRAHRDIADQMGYTMQSLRALAEYEGA